MRTVRAVVENNGSLRPLEDLSLRVGERVSIAVLGPSDEVTLLSQAALADDWERPEEDEAWAHLQDGTRHPNS